MSTEPQAALVRALERELESARRMQQLLEDEHLALLHGPAEQVAQIGGRKVALAREIAALGEARDAALASARLPAGRRGLELAGAAYRAQRDALRDCARRLRALNERNGALIEGGLSRVAGMLAILFQGNRAAEAPIYASDGRLQGAAVRRMHTEA